MNQRASKNQGMKKPLIIAGVIVVIAVLAFLIYDEVKVGNYQKAINQAIQNTTEIEAGTSVGATYGHTEGDMGTANQSQVTREAYFVRSDDGITFQEATVNEISGEVLSDFFVKPDEYYYMGTDGKYVRTDLESGLGVRPYSLGTATSEIDSSRYKRIRKTEVDGQEAYEVIYNRQWLINNYQSESSDEEPISGSITYVIGYDDEQKPYIQKTSQEINVRVTDDEGNKTIQLIGETSELTPGNTEEIQATLDKYFETNIKNNYIESTELEEETTEESTTTDETTIGSSGEDVTVGSSQEDAE